MKMVFGLEMFFLGIVAKTAYSLTLIFAADQDRGASPANRAPLVLLKQT